MKITFSGNAVEVKKSLSELDRLVIDFTAALDAASVRYVIVSGYVSILFGRNRASEDIDIITGRLDLGRFRKLWGKLSNLDCINANGMDDARSCLQEGTAVRFSRKGAFIPNVEMKFAKSELDAWTVGNAREARLNGHMLFISPLELQIPFKLFLGSEKDIEDARFLYGLFKGRIDMKALAAFNVRLETEKQFAKHMR